MEDRNKSKKELCCELSELKSRLADLEFADAERSVAERDLRESEGRVRMAVECLNEGLLITDLDDVVLCANSPAN